MNMRLRPALWLALLLCPAFASAADPVPDQPAKPGMTDEFKAEQKGVREAFRQKAQEERKAFEAGLKDKKPEEQKALREAFRAKHKEARRAFHGQQKEKRKAFRKQGRLKAKEARRAEKADAKP